MKIFAASLAVTLFAGSASAAIIDFKLAYKFNINGPKESFLMDVYFDDTKPDDVPEEAKIHFREHNYFFRNITNEESYRDSAHVTYSVHPTKIVQELLFGYGNRQSGLPYLINEITLNDIYELRVYSLTQYWGVEGVISTVDSRDTTYLTFFDGPSVVDVPVAPSAALLLAGLAGMALSSRRRSQ